MIPARPTGIGDEDSAEKAGSNMTAQPRGLERYLTFLGPMFTLLVKSQHTSRAGLGRALYLHNAHHTIMASQRSILGQVRGCALAFVNDVTV